MIAYIKAFTILLGMTFILTTLSQHFKVKDPDFIVGFGSCWAYIHSLNFFRGQE